VDNSSSTAPPGLPAMTEAIAARLHLHSDHYKDFGGPLGPDEGSTYLCNCRDKAAIAADTVDAVLLQTFVKIVSGEESTPPSVVEEDVRGRVAEWLERQADAWEYVAVDAGKAAALRWAARAVREHADENDN